MYQHVHCQNLGFYDAACKLRAQVCLCYHIESSVTQTPKRIALGSENTSFPTSTLYNLPEARITIPSVKMQLIFYITDVQHMYHRQLKITRVCNTKKKTQ